MHLSRVEIFEKQSEITAIERRSPPSMHRCVWLLCIRPFEWQSNSGENLRAASHKFHSLPSGLKLCKAPPFVTHRKIAMSQRGHACSALKMMRKEMKKIRKNLKFSTNLIAKSIAGNVLTANLLSISNRTPTNQQENAVAHLMEGPRGHAPPLVKSRGRKSQYFPPLIIFFWNFSKNVSKGGTLWKFFKKCKQRGDPLEISQKTWAKGGPFGNFFKKT